MPSAELRAGIHEASRIVGGRKSPLAEAVATLASPERKAMFVVCYATMRLADDRVDDHYLARPRRERRALRPGLEAWLAAWLDQCERAARGDYVAREGDLQPALFTALNHLVGGSAIGAAPWRRLAAALRRDLAERPIRDWAEYREYAEGACVAPASVFVYLLGCEFAPGGRSHFPHAERPDELARDLALFAYLVHLLRDFREDLARDEQLVQIPRDWLPAGARLDGPPEFLEPAFARLRGHVVARRAAADAACRRAAAVLPPREHAALVAVRDRYAEQWEQLRADA